MEKRLKIVIDKAGNLSIETKQGFIGNQCQQTIDTVMAAVGGTCMEERPTDDMFKNDDPSAFANNF